MVTRVPSRDRLTAHRRPLVAALGVTAVLTVGCSGSDAAPETTPAEATSSTSSAGPTTTTSIPSTTSTSTTVVADPDVEPVVRLPDNPRGDVGGFNMGVVTMAADRVELWWTSVEGDDVQHRVHRVPLVGTDPATVELTSENLVYVGAELGFVDETAEPGRFWTYVLEIDADGVTSERRAWTSALTVDDTTPPEPIENLTAELTDDGVLLSWDPSGDDVEFAAYAVILLGPGGADTYLGGATEPAQSRFLDDRPTSGTNTYQVDAVDFHGNRTSATVEIVVP